MLITFFILGTLLLPLGSAFAADNVELHLWVNDWVPAAQAALQKVVDSFAEQHPEVKSVVLQPVNRSQVVEKLTVAIAGGTPPDAVALRPPFSQYAFKGMIQPLDRWVAQSRVVKRQDYPAMIFDGFSANGALYGIPAIEVGPGMLLHYSQDRFNEAGLAPSGLRTLDDLLLYSRRLTRVDSTDGRVTQVGLNPVDSTGANFFPDVFGTMFNTNWYNAAKQQINLLEFESAVNYVSQFFTNPSYNQMKSSGMAAGGTGWTQGLNKGNLGMQINGYWVPGELRALKTPYEFGHTWVPSAIGDKATAIMPFGLAIPANASRPDLSFQLIEYFTGLQAAQTLFDAVGWLNGNLTTMRRLNLRDLIVVKEIVGMFDTANRIGAPVALPTLEVVRQRMQTDLNKVWDGSAPARSVLETMQTQLQSGLNDLIAATKK